MDKLKPLVVSGLVCLFVLLFYQQTPGLNVLLFNLAVVACVLLYFPHNNFTLNQKIIIGSFLLGSIAFVVHFTALAFIFSIFSGSMMISFIKEPRLKSVFYAFPEGLFSIPFAAKRFVGNLADKNPVLPKPAFFSLAIIPLLITGFYIFMYSLSSPFFNTLVLDVSDFLISLIFWDIDLFQLLLLLVLGVFVSAPFFYSDYHRFIATDIVSPEFLTRSKSVKKSVFKLKDLINEYRAGVMLFILLNTLLLIVNVLDIWNVWFGFEWEGQYLKQFVHEGTYILIFSILLSVGLILYFFRKNLNFYSENNLLKWLAYVWLAQNALLAVSVAIRNIWYINYFALAYKRIGVIFFLIFIMILIVSVILKVQQKRSFYYLLRVNSWSFFYIMLFMCLFNWDNIIANYNLSNYKRSFVHWDFLVNLPDKTLPILVLAPDEVQDIEVAQKNRFNFRAKYMEASKYAHIIDYRKEEFKVKWEKKGWLSWNFAEYMAYRDLQKN